MDSIGWFIATTHSLLGHDKTAAFLGVPPGDKEECALCIYERNPSDITRQRVIRALSGTFTGDH